MDPDPCCPEIRRRGSRGLAVVEAEKTAKTFPTVDLSNAIRRLRGHNQLVVESLMVSLLVIVLRVLKDRAPQMGLAQRNQAVQAFRLNRKHKSLRESVQVRTVSR